MDRKLKTKMYGGEHFTYPSDHKLGVITPEGGSMCGNCSFLGTDHKTCKQKEWVKWNGGDNKLPVKDERYCCDLWNPSPGSMKESKQEVLKKYTR